MSLRYLEKASPAWGWWGAHVCVNSPTEKLLLSVFITLKLSISGPDRVGNASQEPSTEQGGDFWDERNRESSEGHATILSQTPEKIQFHTSCVPMGQILLHNCYEGKKPETQGNRKMPRVSWLPELKPGLDFIYSTQSPCLQNPGWLGRSPCTLVPVLSVVLDLCRPLSMWGEHSFWVRFKGLPPTSELCNMAPYKLLWGFYTELFWQLLCLCKWIC